MSPCTYLLLQRGRLAFFYDRKHATRFSGSNQLVKFTVSRARRLIISSEKNRWPDLREVLRGRHRRVLLWFQPN